MKGSMTWLQWVELLGDRSYTSSEYGVEFYLSEKTARTRLSKAVVDRHLVATPHGQSIRYSIRRYKNTTSDYALFCGSIIEYLDSLPAVCWELPHIFFAALLKEAEVTKYSDRVVYSIETNASREVSQLAVSINEKVECIGNRLWIRRKT